MTKFQHTIYIQNNVIYFLQADILQSSQRRPGVHGGAILFKNK
jgi:hypothetical protein